MPFLQPPFPALSDTAEALQGPFGACSLGRPAAAGTAGGGEPGLRAPQPPLGALCIPPRPQGPLERDAVLVDRAPRPQALAMDRHMVLVEVPVPVRTGVPASQIPGDHGSELRHPLPPGLVEDPEPALERQFPTTCGLSEKRRHSQTARAVTASGKRWRS